MLPRHRRGKSASITLIAIPFPDLFDLSESRLPAGVASCALEGSLPPEFVARRSFDQLAQGKPAQWCTTFYMLRSLDHAVVGSCGFKDAPVDAQVEIGYAVSPTCRNTGIATAAVAALLHMAFMRSEVNQVLAQVNPDNLASTRVVEKLGFKAHGTSIDKDNEVLAQWLVERSNLAR